MTNTADGSAPAQGTQIPPEWQRWLAQNLIRGVPVDAIVREMAGQGFDEATIACEVDAASTHPYVLAGTDLAAAQHSATPEDSAARADKYEWILEVIRRGARLSSSHGSVPRVTAPSSGVFLEDFYSRNRPCVIEGAMTDWPALTKWTPQFLKDGRSDRPVMVEVFRDDDPRSHARRQHEMTFGDFVDAVEAGATNGLYMTAGSTKANWDVIESLWEDLSFPDYLDPEHPFGKGLLWYGPAGTVTPMHHDLTNNMMAQVRGRKRVRLIAPYETADVYNVASDRYSPVDIEEPDLAAYPNMRRVTTLEVEIGPGDMLFVPVGWWHGVRSLDTSITLTFMNFAYDTDFHSPRQP